MSKRTSKSDPFAEREAAKYANPIPSREFITGYLLERRSPANLATLVAELNLSSQENQEALSRRIKAMLRDRQLERLRGGLYWPTGHRAVIAGVVQVDRGKKNQTWVLPEDNSPKILLPLKDASRVYHGNRVMVSVVNLPGAEVREGALVEILEQKPITIVARFVKEKGFSYAIPHGKEIPNDVLIPQGKEKSAEDGDIVMVEIDTKPSRFAEPLGEVKEILGAFDTPGIEIRAVARAFGLSETWPDPVLREIRKIKETIPAAAKAGRLDLREFPLVTIDGEDAKDFDDAVYCEKRKGGGWRLYVAIADVSYYVKPDTALDAEAKERGNSVYFPGKVIPMLPEVLSNGLCSLNPKMDRLCLVAVMNISPQGGLKTYEFHEGIMRSAARFTYTRVAALLKDLTIKPDKEEQQLLPHLKELESLYHVLRAEREKRGAIEFETVETKINFDKNSKIASIEPVIRNEAHKIIEECMLMANVATARFLKKNKLPGLYRIHEGPPPDKLNDLRLFLTEMGLSLGGGDKPEPIHYSKLLASIGHRPDANVIQTVLLRSLTQAMYSPDNLGHFGLAYPAYSHFTSPIRRYPDLLIHRQIRLILQGQWTAKAQAQAKKEEVQASLVALGEHTSKTERRADEATRDAIRWLKCEYIKEHLGETFEGIISGVTRFGFFVELKDIYIDGLVHVTSLQDDYYYFDPIHHRLIGERTRRTFRLGDPVTVKLINVDVQERKVDFEILTAMGTSGARKQKGKSNIPKKRSFSRDNEGARKRSSARGPDKSTRKQNFRSKPKKKRS